MSDGGPSRPDPRDRARFTSRAAVLAVVICAIALSLAYPVREYVAQRRQIDQLQAENQVTAAQLSRLQAEAQRLGDPAYVEQQARDRLHLCMPGKTCYVIIGGQPAAPTPPAAVVAAAPWDQRLWHPGRRGGRGASRGPTPPRAPQWSRP